MKKYIVPTSMTADELKKYRKSLGFTQKDFAELIGVSKPTVERWEVADKPISGPIVLLMRLLTATYLESVRIPEKKFPLRLWYMYKEEVCTLIDVDERKELVEIKNYTKKKQFQAFGANESPSFADYEEFLESRCFARQRDKMKVILKDLDLPFYDPFMIIEKTQGRMAEDDFWIRVER